MGAVDVLMPNWNGERSLQAFFRLSVQVASSALKFLDVLRPANRGVLDSKYD